MSGGEANITVALLNKPAENDREEDELGMKEKVWNESKKLWVVAAPAIFTRFSTFGVSMISQAFIGHLGPIELAAYSITFTVLLRFSNGILLGMASALETLCGQAYGAKQNHMLGIYLQRSWIVLTGCTICLMPVYIFSGPILLALGQEERIVRVARIIALWVIGVNFSFVPSFTCQMFLQAQSKNKIIAYVAAVSLAVHVFLSWLLMIHFDFGITGAMTSTLVAFWLPNIAQLLFVTCGGCKDTWRGFSMLAFKDLWPVFKLSMSSGGMLCLELWYNSILVLLTGNLKNAEVALDALAICININGLEMMIALGFLAAASVRVSNELGRGNSKGAKFATLNAVFTSLSIGFVLFFVFLFLRGRVSYIFTTSEAVAAEVADLSPLLACSILMNSVQPVLSGVAVGAGWQGYVTYVNLACYYLIGIPSGVILGYVVGLEVKGVWIGMLFGVFVQTCVLCIMTLRTDWDQQVSTSLRRLNRWVVPDESSADLMDNGTVNEVLTDLQETEEDTGSAEGNWMKTEDVTENNGNVEKVEQSEKDKEEGEILEESPELYDDDTEEETEAVDSGNETRPKENMDKGRQDQMRKKGHERG
ncbi:hypothetical protein IGI04_030305 [Brassica rapa subsp. trilocularis]|uniref:Protein DETOXIFICATION n=1 Tax=Brassica rapa subsp. trilocularis TaxID=1813537 RepID=A0ABQ7LQD9_BRACM|nr:hypothetical protein IGI04_030305 [Brassica rapa subsp. trilocularis]